MTVRPEIVDAIGWLRIERPPVNALSKQSLADLRGALDSLIDNPAVRSIVITGTGKTFSAGADVKEYAAAEPEQAIETFRTAHRCFAAIETSGKPVIAAINGPAMGGGLELALACDLRLCADTATFGMPESRLGGIPCWGAFRRLPRTVGMAWARWLILTGIPVDATQAAAIGLVHQVAAPDGLEAAARDLADRLSRLPPLALVHAKRLLSSSEWLDDRAIEDAELSAQGVLMQTRDVREGLDAFLAHREPVFGGS